MAALIEGDTIHHALNIQFDNRPPSDDSEPKRRALRLRCETPELPSAGGDGTTTAETFGRGFVERAAAHARSGREPARHSSGELAGARDRAPAPSPRYPSALQRRATGHRGHVDGRSGRLRAFARGGSCELSKHMTTGTTLCHESNLSYARRVRYTHGYSA